MREFVFDAHFYFWIHVFMRIRMFCMRDCACSLGFLSSRSVLAEAFRCASVSFELWIRVYCRKIRSGWSRIEKKEIKNIFFTNCSGVYAYANLIFFSLNFVVWSLKMSSESNTSPSGSKQGSEQANIGKFKNRKRKIPIEVWEILIGRYVVPISYWKSK